MKAKKLFITILVLVFTASMAGAQGWLGKLKDKAEDAAKRTVEKNVEDKTEKAVDDAINGRSGEKNDKSSKNKKSSKNDSDDQDDENGNNGGKKSKQAKGESVKSDFVAGTIVIFEDDFANEQMGEFPSKWDLLDGNAEVGKMNGKKGIKFEHGHNAQVTPLVEDNNKKYLPDFYTLEFDFFVTGKEDHNSAYNLYMETSDEDGEKQSRIFLFTNHVSWSVAKPNSGRVDGETNCEDLYEYNDWNHFALSFNKRALKAYINGQRVINIPNAIAADWFNFETEFWEDHIDYITNVRLAKGGVELYERKASDMSAIEKSIAETGKFVTNNILFDTGKATLKPESMEEIGKVADFMKKNPSVRFEVQGHTDNQGSDKINDPLSQQRAEAVVKALESLGCDGFNLRAVGKGSHEPIADNKTEEGRAKNRRVVFVKK